ncbi:protein-glutamine gamma-glutamyltransferase 2-like isoform X4 [Gambusia affinis]|uniref:protein-glutamine gamma-glutamyltransferase 2-like isoform X4 n=1 Tax=Gambusia affinis TaxID=33528 RepID=UPI001CDD1421|nr:protein-glutamine gamma-glutamyltransferase 2-like isoform X4 [Gambusia affinis]
MVKDIKFFRPGTLRTALDIERCDLNIKDNHSNHHTELFGEERLIVRRGQPFSIALHLSPSSKEFKVGKTNFMFDVETGPLPGRESNTKVTFSSQASTVNTEWSASAATDASGRTVIVSISSSPKAPIGIYTLTLDQLGQKTSLGQFTLLFNAWCPDDAVYLKSEEKRKEYVLAQHGLVYRGSHKRIKGKPWNFGQINSNDDRGVLVGQWVEFSNGIHPGLWMGSGEILRQWAERGPVRYGQCWVFAAVACTVSRALGIPCRVVTNFGSAHDTNANLVIERLYDENGDRISGDDSIWNFHVWVDSWMTRPDLGSKFDGWQTSDPTPQEKSDGVFCCGPASLYAIKEGEVGLKYDTPFIFAEVNADVEDLVKLSTGQFVTFSECTKSVGLFISTKAVGSNERRDITHQYKYPEGSKEEREVYERAHHRNVLLQRGEKLGLHLKIKLAENMIVGSSFEVYARLTNNCMDTKTCKLIFYARAVSYNGKLGELCGFSSDHLEVPSGQERRLSLKLEYQRYKTVITSDLLIQVSAITINKETVDFQKAEKTIVLDEPDIGIKLVGEARVNQPVTVKLTLLNSLPEPLLNCSFAIDGIGLTGGKPITAMVGTVGANEQAKASVVFKPTVAGSSVLLVNFDSDKLKNIKNVIDVVVKE